MPGFKASEDRLTLLLGANAAHEVSVHLPFKKKKKILRPSIIVNLLCLCSINGVTKLDDSITWFAEYFKPTVETYY